MGGSCFSTTSDAAGIAVLTRMKLIKGGQVFCRNIARLFVHDLVLAFLRSSNSEDQRVAMGHFLAISDVRGTSAMPPIATELVRGGR